MARLFLVFGSLSGGLGVIFGAFGAHLLKNRLAPEILAAFETGVQYQIYHSLALLFIGLASERRPGLKWLHLSGWSFLVGTVVFSGSLYFLSMGGLRSLGVVTPIGGLALIVGWTALGVAMVQRRARDNPHLPERPRPN